MTVMAVRKQQMLVEEFEEIASAAPETVTLEFLDGRIGVKSVPDGDHDTIIAWLTKRCIQSRPDLDFYVKRGLRVETYRKGRARPDGLLVPEALFAGQGEWADPEGVLMAVEVTSYDEDTDQRDRQEKPAAYAGAGIPVHLLIDRDSRTLTVHRNPERGRYRDTHTAAFGEPVTLPEPVSISLDTAVLKNYVR